MLTKEKLKLDIEKYLNDGGVIELLPPGPNVFDDEPDYSDDIRQIEEILNECKILKT